MRAIFYMHQTSRACADLCTLIKWRRLLQSLKLGQTNLILFFFAGKTWKKVGAVSAIKIKKFLIFINRTSNFEFFLTVFVMIYLHVYLSKPSVGAGSWYAMCFTSIRVCFPDTMMSTSS